MLEMSYPARQEKEISGFAETEVCVCVWYWLLFSFFLSWSFPVFLPSHCHIY